jgi:hypothetical protein|tara:strand:- start:1295 stop:1486 length:192 start_codon:yes stop_codon:yes gene_type:complete
MTLDTSATLAALARANDIAKARKLAINAIERETRCDHSAQVLKALIQDILHKLDISERDAINK